MGTSFPLILLGLGLLLDNAFVLNTETNEENVGFLCFFEDGVFGFKDDFSSLYTNTFHLFSKGAYT